MIREIFNKKASCLEPIELTGVHVQNGKEVLKNYVVYHLKPTLLKTLETKLEEQRNLANATPTSLGLVRIATDEEVNRLSGEVYAVLTPQKARQIFIEKESFQIFKNEIENLLSDKADQSSLTPLEGQLVEINQKIDELGALLDSINGQVI